MVQIRDKIKTNHSPTSSSTTGPARPMDRRALSHARTSDHVCNVRNRVSEHKRSSMVLAPPKIHHSHTIGKLTPSKILVISRSNVAIIFKLYTVVFKTRVNQHGCWWSDSELRPTPLYVVHVLQPYLKTRVNLMVFGGMKMNPHQHLWECVLFSSRVAFDCFSEP